MIVLGYDVGGTKIEAAVVSFFGASDAQNTAHDRPARDWQFDIRSRVRRPTERTKGYDHIVAQMVDAGRQALHDAGVAVSQVHALGMGLPGAVDPQAGIMRNGNTLALIDRPVTRDLASGLGLSQVQVALGNDANCFALAEHYCGVGRELARARGVSPRSLTSIGIILGTGCGGGFVLEGQLVQGANGGAAEVGHTVLVRDGHACYCGQRGCAEQYLSGTAIEAHFASRRYAQVQSVVTARDIFEHAENGEPLAVAVIKDYVDHLASFVAGLTNLLDPDYFVFGGGVSLQPAIYKGLEHKVLARTFLPLKRICIEQHQLGDSSGVVGAALLPIYRQEVP
jgi:fructokinase